MKLDHLSVDEIIEEAVRREHAMMRFYGAAKEVACPDTRKTMHQLHRQHRDRITQLEELLKDVQDLRNLSIAMAD